MTTITLLDRPSHVPLTMSLELDLLSTTEVRLSEAVQRISQGDLSLSYTLPLVVSNTPKNLILLGDTPRKNFRCEVKLNGYPLPITALYWYNITNTEISLDLIHAQRDWASLLKNRKLNEIEYRINGSVSILEEDVQDMWANGGEWQDDTHPFYFAPIRYNGLVSQLYTSADDGIDYTNIDGVTTLTYSDLRPLISMLFTLKEMFKLIGWNFRSPFFEADYGRSIYAYILKPEFAKDSGLRHRFEVKYVGASFNTHDSSNLKFNTINYSGGNFIISTSPSTGAYYISPLRHPSKMNFYTSLKLSHALGVKKIVEVTIRIMYDTTSLTNEVFDYKKEDFVIEAGQTLDCTMEWKNAIVLPQYRVEVRARIVDGTSLTCYEDSWFRGETTGDVYYYGDLLNPQVVDDSCLEYLKGAAHICSGHFLTDAGTKTVTLLPPVNRIVEGDAIEGFYTTEIEDLDCNNYTVSFDKTTNNNLVVGWKGTQDIKADDTNYKYFGSKQIKLSDEQGLTEATNLNPYFNAVFEGNMVHGVTESPLIPAIETSKDDFSFVLTEVDRFAVACFGLQYQSLRSSIGYSELSTPILRKFSLIGDITHAPIISDLIPYFSQLPTAYNAAGYPIRAYHRFCYGSVPNDLSQYFYEPFTKALKLEFLSNQVFLNDILNTQFFRGKRFVLVDGNPYVAYLTGTTDFQEGLTALMSAEIGIYTDPIPCDRQVTKSKFTVSTDIVNPSHNFDCYVESIKIDNVELIDVPYLIGNPAFMGAVDFYNTLTSFINLYVTCSYSTGAIFIEAAKCGWYQITLRDGNGSTLINRWRRFDPIALWSNISYGSGASTDTATWRVLSSATDKIDRYV